MPERPSIGLALIAKNEADTLPDLLASIEGAFDEVILVDTGSRDDTVAVFERWGDAEQEAGRLQRFGAAPFEWVNDFAAARAFADSLMSADWVVWADADDVIAGAGNLRELAASAPAEQSAFIFGYRYADDGQGNCICYLWRERLVRRGHGTWSGRVHEAQTFPGQATMVGPEVCEWVHRKRPEAASSNDRNLKILRAWVRDEPENARVLAYLGTEQMVRGKLRLAAGYFRRYLKLKTGWDEERAQVHRKLALCLNAEGRYDAALRLAFAAIELMPSWPDSYLTLAEVHYHREEYAKAAEWAREVIRRGAPQTMLIVNPLEYSYVPRRLLAGAQGALGQVDEAIATAEEAFEIVQGDPALLSGYNAWRTTRKREFVAKNVCELAEVLVIHDEQLNALQVLQAAPHFVRDHAQVVELRSRVRERIQAEEAPERLVADERVMDVGDALPRCEFLLRGVREQVAA